MATVKKEKQKLVPVSWVKEHERMQKLMEHGIRCTVCGQLRTDENYFYRTTEPYNRIKYSCVCKECIRKIAAPKDEDGIERPTKETIMLACQILNKPFISSLYEASVIEANNETTSNLHDNPWTAYIKNVSMNQYNGMTWLDSDHLGLRTIDPLFKAERPVDKKVEKMLEEHKGQDTYDSYLKNKEDIIRLIDYDPFEAEAVEDQPFLYAQLVGMLDNAEESNEDMFRTNSAIAIARAFLQAQKIDNTIAKMTGTVKDMEKNAAVIKNLQETKKNTLESARKLAEESCLTIKNSKTRTRGSETFTGKLAKIRDMSLRDGENNGFDIDTCKGMQQVANISMSAIIDKLKLDDSEWADIVRDQREQLSAAILKAKMAEEAFRLLLRENLDFRDLLKEKGWDITEDLVDLDELLNTYVVDPKEEKDE